MHDRPECFLFHHSYKSSTAECNEAGIVSYGKSFLKSGKFVCITEMRTIQPRTKKIKGREMFRRISFKNLRTSCKEGCLQFLQEMLLLHSPQGLSEKQTGIFSLNGKRPSCGRERQLAVPR